MPNEIMPEKLAGYRPATIEEELRFTKSGGELLQATNVLQLADARLLGLEEKKSNLMRQLDDARKAIQAAQVRHTAVLDSLGIAVGDDKALKNVDGVWYLREKTEPKKE